MVRAPLSLRCSRGVPPAVDPIARLKAETAMLSESVTEAGLPSEPVMETGLSNRNATVQRRDCPEHNTTIKSRRQEHGGGITNLKLQSGHESQKQGNLRLGSGKYNANMWRKWRKAGIAGTTIYRGHCDFCSGAAP